MSRNKKFNAIVVGVFFFVLVHIIMFHHHSDDNGSFDSDSIIEIVALLIIFGVGVFFYTKDKNEK